MKNKTKSSEVIGWLALGFLILFIVGKLFGVWMQNQITQEAGFNTEGEMREFAKEYLDKQEQLLEQKELDQRVRKISEEAFEKAHK